MRRFGTALAVIFLVTVLSSACSAKPGGSTAVSSPSDKSGYVDPRSTYTDPPYGKQPPPEVRVSVAEAQGKVPFKIRLPKDPKGLSLKDAVVHGEAGVAMRTDNFDFAQWHESSEGSAAARVLENLPTGRFDSRFMERVEISGSEAIAWEAIDTGPVDGGVVVPFSGIMFRIGQDWFTIQSLHGKLSRAQIVQMAREMAQ